MTPDTSPPSAEILDAPPAGDTVAMRLRCALTLRGTFAHRVSLAAGLARGTARWILDHPTDSPRASTVAALARALAVDPAWLAFGHPYPAPAALARVEGAEDLPTAPEESPPPDASRGSKLAPSAEVLPLAELAGGVPPEGKRDPIPAAPSDEDPREVPRAQLLPAPDARGVFVPDPDALRARWRATPGAVQRDFAARTGMAQSTASQFLSGRAKQGSPATLRAVAAYLDALDAERAEISAPMQRALPLDAPR